jgi:hypothetical protein
VTSYPPSNTPYLPPPEDSPIKDLERLWLLTACTYELFDEETMEDAYWDKFALNLQQREPEWSPYFRACLPLADYNVGTTASGVLWEQNNVARQVYEACVEFYGVDPLGIL